MTRRIIVGVLALQGAFYEHLRLLKAASIGLTASDHKTAIIWEFLEVRTPSELAKCDALIIPGGESTTVSLVAERSNLLEPLREFVKVSRKPVWGTCAGLILLAESANRTKKGGQELIGGLDVRVNRNYFGRQIESFEAALQLPFLNQGEESDAKNEPFRGIFIRAPVVETLLSSRKLKQEAGEEEVGDDGVVRAPSRDDRRGLNDVEIMATLPGRSQALKEKPGSEGLTGESGDIVAVLQDNVFGTSFHPELTNDARIHQWWLKRVSAIGLP